MATHVDLLYISHRNIHCRGGRRSEEPLSLEVALAHFKEKEREKKLAVAASRIGELVSSKEGKKPKHGSSGESLSASLRACCGYVRIASKTWRTSCKLPCFPARNKW